MTFTFALSQRFATMSASRATRSLVRMSQARSHNGTRAGQSAEQIAKAAWRDCEAIKDVHLGSVIYLMKELDDDGDPEEDDDDN